MRPYPRVNINALPDFPTKHAVQRIDKWLIEVEHALKRLNAGQETRGTGTTITNTGITDHHLLTNLTAFDDHTQYLYLGGRASSQTVYGLSTTASVGGLMLHANSSASTAHSRIELESNTCKVYGEFYAFDEAGGGAVLSLTEGAGFGNMTLNGSFLIQNSGINGPQLQILNQASGSAASELLQLTGKTGQTGTLYDSHIGSTSTGHHADYYDASGVLASYIAADGTWTGAVSGGAAGWTDDGTVVRLTTATDNVSVGTASDLSAKLGVLAAASAIGTVVKHTSGTADLSQWQNSSGAGLFRITSVGEPVLGNLLYLRGRNAADAANYGLVALDGSNILRLAAANVPSIFLDPSGTTLVRVRGDANVGVNIGDSSAPGAMLDVRGQATGRVVAIDRAVSGQTADIYQTFDGSAAQQFTIDKSGFVNTTKLLFADGTTNTKQLALDLSGTTAAIKGTLAASFTTAKTVTLPNLTGTLMSLGASGTSNTQTAFAGFRFRHSTTGTANPPLVLYCNGANTTDLLEFWDSSAATVAYVDYLGGATFKNYAVGDLTSGISGGITYLIGLGGASGASNSFLGRAGATSDNSTSLILGGQVDPLSVGTGGTAVVDLTAQAASIAATTLYTTTKAGFYRISVNATCSTAGAASNLTVSVTWTQGGVTRTAVLFGTNSVLGITAPLDLSSTANADGATFPIYADTSTAIQYTATRVSATGAKFDFHCRLEWVAP